ncbi:hypothetical protein [Algibacter sp. PT7-4]|uniref:hypothetical protein n=1 Tax=Algibacter ulvanivorans TaxID=3400999 RepID=UPI003AAFDBE5
MKVKFLYIAITCFITTSVFAQTSINNYKYVIVPEKFDFLKNKDQYQLNSLAEFLFNKHGFIAVMEGTEYPEDLLSNRCLSLKSNVLKGSGMFKTKLTVELKDCNDRVIYTTAEGESREKEYKTAYNLALRDAFKSIEALNYNYKPNTDITSIGNGQAQVKPEVSAEIEQLKKEIQDLKKEKETEVTIKETPKPEVTTTQPKAIEKAIPTAATVIQGDTNVLYAQAITHGFQLVDSSPKVVYKIKKTNLKDVYLVESKNAIIYKKDNDWVIEYYASGILQQDVLNIKF